MIKDLGSGTFGKVCLADDLLNKRKVAIKELDLKNVDEKEVKMEVKLHLV